MGKYEKLKRTSRDPVVSVGAAVVHSPEGVAPYIDKGGQVIFLGDEHAYRPGHEAIVALIPKMAESGVKLFGLELPPKMNGDLRELQNYIRQNHPSFVQARQLFFEMLEKHGISSKDVTGGNKNITDWARITYAATQNGMDVVGLDPRIGNKEWTQKAVAIAKRLDKGDKSAEKELVGHLRSMDKEAAANLQEHLKHLPSGARAAVMYGALHGCAGPNTTSLVQSLQDAGISSTVIAFVTKGVTAPNGTCEMPANIAVQKESPFKRQQGAPSMQKSATP